MASPFEVARWAADELKALCGVTGFDVAIVLGSGWKEGAAALGEPDRVVPVRELPGFAEPTVAGHSGQIISLEFAGRRVALLSGRVHLYEGHPVATVVHPVRTLVEAGARTVVLTNGCGGIDPSIWPGKVAMITDHINLQAASPLEGEAPPEGFGPRFVDLTDLYSARLRAATRAVAPELAEGVYVGVRGPHYETKAEIQMVRQMGASLVGMSTVLEAIAARHLGAEVLGLSLVTNLAAGMSPGPLEHEEVLATGREAATSLGELLTRVLPAL
ncbi:MAG: purine-nucleoside phosphorylase [Acidobacteriota bacterium]|nr:purine-nucleoside phosphorylase [Acidobacteriota bacterium]